MTDLNKLRSEFEAVTETYHCIYNADLDYYFSGSKFVSDKAEIEVNAGWKAWKKAKAQTVPDTHIVVPKQPTPKMIDATWDFDDEIIEMSSNTRNEFIWKKMVEASESGAEG
ncbi:hypothetical protein ABTP57_04655 [Acinetobacter baumannii]